MGAVYRARDERTSREVALKLIAPELARDPVFLERFRREARAAASVRHEGVVGVHDVGEALGQVYLALELVEGGSLGARLARGPLAWREAAPLFADVARALGAIHEAGLVHRDLKPENILLDREGRPKVSDFGLVKRAGPSESLSGSLTTEGEVVGTPRYMAPEQLDPLARVTASTDLYALGVTLFAALAGRPPFLKDGIALVKQHTSEPAPSLASAVAGVPARLSALVASLHAY
jgi:serine/threonine protein kinase